MHRGILLIFIVLSVTVNFTASRKEFKSTLSALDDGFCRALSFEGGGDKAAYEAGVLQGFIEGMSSPQDYAYDVVSGVSTGSINAMAFALFKKGEEKKVSEKLKETWESIKTSDVLQSWPWGIIQGVFYKGSIYDNSPFKTFLEKFAEGYQLQRQVYISAADANTAEYVVFDGSEMENTKELADAVFASSSIPGIFPPTELHGRTLIDGGTIWNINVFAAIEGCRRKGFADDKIIVDVVMNSYAEIDTNKDVSDFGALDMFFRYLDINQYYKVTDYITMLPLDYPDINVRYVVHPSSPLYSGITINFDHDQLVKIEQTGKQDALNAIKLGSKKNLEVFSNYIKQYKGNQEFTESYQSYFKRQTAQHLG